MESVKFNAGRQRESVSVSVPKPGRIRFSELSVPRQVLVRLCQSLNYGQIQGLRVHDGEPVFDPAPLVLVELKLDAEETERPEIELVDFELRNEVCSLMTLLDEMKNGSVEQIEVRAGIPRRATFKSYSQQS
jgi:hypothetical protein